MQAPENLDFYIETIKPDDVPAMIDMIRDTLDPFEEAGSVLAATYRRLNNFEQVYDGKHGIYFVVKDRSNHKLVGGAGFGPFAGLPPAEKIGEIRELVISPVYRGKGAGKAIIGQCVTHAKKAGYSRIYLETTPKMEHAQNLFRRFKFKPVTHKLEQHEEGETVPCYFMLEALDEA
ncbi:GNAT family N-acetyltransferase [Pseudobacteriovorax antillogorgiicola]|uniref:N-acetylglutamate synthase, GNAT family n=1 Tax=Pseudobacteriovorax antillogorgiicola TaxID=1513793 RepID=A0A1Y6CBC5_9BACT|nr:GNAT family N-acetyltransferase [Pseudobacteriovorax antillogorgiicola]TCS48639.1 N-acetylglutamate synthase-like GNAT family acetyltransferase [Pseudobacteriovorax antillogorgiicola]SMF55294.1 N-acetylglutamate synthase, GNAT family [Pseudobacteriovorax antillogorgiicola]